MKNFTLGVLLSIFLLENALLGFFLFCPTAKRIYLKSKPESAVIEIEPMPIQQLPHINLFEKNA